MLMYMLLCCHIAVGQVGNEVLDFQMRHVSLLPRTPAGNLASTAFGGQATPGAPSCRSGMTRAFVPERCQGGLYFKVDRLCSRGPVAVNKGLALTQQACGGCWALAGCRGSDLLFVDLLQVVCCNSLPGPVSLVAISGSARNNWGRKGDAMKQLRRELLQMEEEVSAGIWSL